MEAEFYSFSAALVRVALSECQLRTFISIACLPDPCCLLGICIRIYNGHLSINTQNTMPRAHDIRVFTLHLGTWALLKPRTDHTMQASASANRRYNAAAKANEKKKVFCAA